MMLVPRRNNFDLFDNFFGDDDFFSKKERSLMKTDIKELKDKYEIKMDLPGYEKDNIDIALNDGYLEVSAKVEKEENNSEEEKFVRRERFYGECSMIYKEKSLEWKRKDELKKEKLKNKELTVTEITKAYVDRINEKEPEVKKIAIK